MSATKILWGQITIVFLIVLITTWSATQCAPPVGLGLPVTTPLAADLPRRYPGVNVRDFGGDKGRIAEIDALVAYLQVLGTMVDFKIYEDKKNLR